MMMKPDQKPAPRRISWREIGQLLLVLLAAWGVSQLLQRSAPLGRDIGTHAALPALRADTSAPTREVAEPTLTLVVFTDYQCPACKLADPAMNAAIAADGHVRIVYRDLPIFGPRSERAARVAIASSHQGLYSAVHQRLMQERRSLEDPVIREAVEAAGGNWAQIERDIETHGPAIDQLLLNNRQFALRFGIAGTPSYIADPMLVIGALDEAEFGRIFAQARRRAGAG